MGSRESMWIPGCPSDGLPPKFKCRLFELVASSADLILSGQRKYEEVMAGNAARNHDALLRHNDMFQKVPAADILGRSRCDA